MGWNEGAVLRYPRTLVNRTRLWGAGVASVNAGILGMAMHSMLEPQSRFSWASRQMFRPFCHQMPERSFQLHGAPMCVCHRCFGIYLGLFCGGLLAVLGARANAASRGMWALALVPMGVHVAVIQLFDFVDLWWIRVATGWLFGFWAAWALASAFGTLGPPRAAEIAQG